MVALQQGSLSPDEISAALLALRDDREKTDKASEQAHDRAQLKREAELHLMRKQRPPMIQLTNKTVVVDVSDTSLRNVMEKRVNGYRAKLLPQTRRTVADVFIVNDVQDIGQRNEWCAVLRGAYVWNQHYATSNGKKRCDVQVQASVQHHHEGLASLGKPQDVDLVAGGARDPATHQMGNTTRRNGRRFQKWKKELQGLQRPRDCRGKERLGYCRRWSVRCQSRTSPPMSKI